MDYGTLEETHEGKVPANICEQFCEFGFSADFFETDESDT
jgi:hypothetical protein